MTTTSKVQKIQNFKKVWSFENEAKASRFRNRLEGMTKRLWAVILLDQFYVLPHRVAVKYFKTNFI